jgi:hypothetical protein
VQDFKAAHLRHLKIEEYKIWLEAVNLLERVKAVISLPDDLNVWISIEFLAKDLSRNWLIVNQESAKGSHMEWHS